MFELALDGDAAVFAETSFQVRSIMSQASKGVASYKDLDDLQRTFSVRYPPAYPPVSVDSFYAQVQTPIAEFVMDGVAVERRPIPQQPLSRAYQEPYLPLQYQSNQQRYKYNTPANAKACRTPCIEPVLPPVAGTTNQYVVETASMLQEHDFTDEPIAHPAPADAAVGACLASVEAEPSSSIMPFFSPSQCESADHRTCLEEVRDDEALLKPSVTSLSRASEVVQESGVQGLTVKKDARALREVWAFGLKFCAAQLSVPISLFDTWQTNAKLPRQFRRLSLRISYPRKRTRKKLRRWTRPFSKHQVVFTIEILR
ncbi:hypothetical protein E4U50_001000 [Claviceps purpurea]|nr:hypothetical protein E4U50_001000 [Claviceps purpurea]